MFRKKTIAIIGAGNMGEILIQGLLAAKVIGLSRKWRPLKAGAGLALASSRPAVSLSPAR